MFKRKQTTQEVEVRKPKYELTRLGWLRWETTISLPGVNNYSRYYESTYGEGTYYATGDKVHAEAKAKRKLRKAIRRYNWKNTTHIGTMDL